MYLTREQEEMLKGKYGWAAAKALEVIVKVGEALGASSLVEVKHVHVSGISYSNIGKYGAELIRVFRESGGRARVFTTVNPGCLDYSGFTSLIDNSLAEGQKLIDEAIVEMGFKPVFTCVPYYYRPPMPNEHLAWGESSAVIVANSLYGARTNREGGPLALAAALTGYTYKAGLHLSENRVAKVAVVLDPRISHEYYGAVGLWIGENLNKPPLLRNLLRVPASSLRNMLASAAASGNHALVVIDGLTPRGTYNVDLEDKVTIELSDVENYLASNDRPIGEVLGYIGCPHTLPDELLSLAKLLKKYGPVRSGKLLVTVPREFVAKYSYIVKELKALGAEVAAGTCPVVSKLRAKFDYALTNSGKAFFYLRRVHNLKTWIASVEEVIRVVSGYKP